MKLKDILTEATKVKASVEIALNAARESSREVPIRANKFDNLFDTSKIAKILLDGGYSFKHKELNYFISAEDAAKVEGLTDILVKRNHSGTKVKIGSKTYNIYPDGTSTTSAKAYIITIDGEIVDTVKKSKIESNIKNEIKSGLMVMAIKSDLSAKQIEAIFDGEDEEATKGFYVKRRGNEFKIILFSANDFIGGRAFTIFGQQHTSKNDKFNYYAAGEVTYEQFTKRQLLPAKAYSKSNLQDRKDGMFVAK